MLEVTEVIKVSDNKLKISDEAQNLLNAHISKIANTKADMIEARINNFFQVKKGHRSRSFKEHYDYFANQCKIEKGRVSSLPAYEQRWLIPIELDNLIQSLNQETEEELDIFTNAEYIDYLRRHGYQIKESENQKNIYFINSKC